MRDTNVIEPDAMTSLEAGPDAHAPGQRGRAVDDFALDSAAGPDAAAEEQRIAEDALRNSTLPLIDSAEILDPVVVPPAIAADDDVTRRSGSIAAFFFVFDQCIVSAASFLTTVAVGRAGSREELGRYFLAFSILLFARNWQVQLVTDPYKVFWSRQPRSSRGSYFGSTLVQNSVFTALMMLGLLIYAIVQRFDGGLREMLPVTVILLVSLPFLLFREFIRNVALSHLRVCRDRDRRGRGGPATRAFGPLGEIASADERVRLPCDGGSVSRGVRGLARNAEAADPIRQVANSARFQEELGIRQMGAGQPPLG